MTAVEIYNALLKGAEKHGIEVGWEAEVGDLREFLAYAFFMLTEEQRGAFFVAAADTLDAPEYEEVRKELGDEAGC